jgi:hypothetical protein
MQASTNNSCMATIKGIELVTLVLLSSIMVLSLLLRHWVQHVLRPCRCLHASSLPTLRHGIIRVTHHYHGADTVVHTVVTDAAEPTLVAPPRGAEPFAPHDDGAEAEPLDLEAEALLHVVVLDDVDLVGDPGVLERPGEVLGLGRGEGGEVVLHPDRGGLGVVLGGGRVRVRRRDGEVGAAPVGAVEDGGGADVEEDDGVPGAEVVVDGPAHGVRRLGGEVDGDGEAAVIQARGRGGCGGAEEDARGLGLQRRRRGRTRGRRLHRRQVNGGVRRGLHLGDGVETGGISCCAVGSRDERALASLWLAAVACLLDDGGEEGEKVPEEMESLWTLEDESSGVRRSKRRG